MVFIQCTLLQLVEQICTLKHKTKTVRLSLNILNNRRLVGTRKCTSMVRTFKIIVVCVHLVDIPSPETLCSSLSETCNSGSVSLSKHFSHFWWRIDLIRRCFIDYLISRGSYQHISLLADCNWYSRPENKTKTNRKNLKSSTSLQK